MGITLDEVITRVEEAAEENQRVVDTGIVFNDVTIDMLYCDDTEVIEEHLANYQKCAEEHRQLAEWFKDYKRLKEQEPKTGHWKKWEYGTHRCSICDKFIGRERYPYCPYCGAKMVEPQESEEV